MALENFYQTPSAELEPLNNAYYPSPFTWNGRLGRIDYFLYVLFAYFISVSFAFIAIVAAELSTTFHPWLSYFFSAIWIAILSKRRFNDFNKDSRLALFVFLPGINLFMIFGLMLVPGDLSENQYGVRPTLKKGRKGYFYFFISVIALVLLLITNSFRWGVI